MLVNYDRPDECRPEKDCVTDISTTSAEVICRVVYTMGIITSTQINAFNHNQFK